MRDREGVPALELDADAGPDPGAAAEALTSVSLVDVEEAVVVDDEVDLSFSSSAVATRESAASAILDRGIHSSYLEFSKGMVTNSIYSVYFFHLLSCHRKLFPYYP